MTQTAARVVAGTPAVRCGPPVKSAGAGLRMGRKSVVVCGKKLIHRFPGGAESVKRASGGVARRQQGQDAVNDRIDAKAGGVDAHGAFGRTQRRHRTIGIAGVARENLA